jgi:cytoskeletal protein RodZ
MRLLRTDLTITDSNNRTKEGGEIMSDLGQLLRKARMDRKISLEDLQETTKIRKRYLEAIEEGSYKVLPGSFYVRAFIKSYAEAVGLDPAEVLRMYQSVIPASEPEHIEPMRSKRTTRNTEKIGKWASNLMMISFVVLILGIIYYYLDLNHNGNQTDANPNDEPKRVTDMPYTPNINNGATAAPAPEKKPEPAPTPPPAPKPEVKFVKNQNGIDYYTVTNADKLTIETKITGDVCWISIDSLGEKREKVEKGKNFNNGETQTWDVPNSAFLVFGRSNAVELNVNGTIVTVGNDSNAKRIQLDLQKV